MFEHSEDELSKDWKVEWEALVSFLICVIMSFQHEYLRLAGHDAHTHCDIKVPELTLLW
jgi:hypothetical protein